MKKSKKPQNIEEHILESARIVFVNKGWKSATMSDISKEAGISRTSLNYYFRSKEKLFEKIFENVFSAVLPQIKVVINSDEDIFSKFEKIINSYTDVLLKNPNLPIFIVSEVNRDPKHLFKVLKSILGKSNPALQLKTQLEHLMKIGKIKNVPLPYVATTYLGIMIFPFLSKNLLCEVFFNSNEDAFKTFILERRKLILETMKNLLEIK